MHLVITISQFSLTQFQKTNNKEIQLPLKIKYNYFFPEGFFFYELPKKELSKAQSHFKKEKSMAAGKNVLINLPQEKSHQEEHQQKAKILIIK